MTTIAHAAAEIAHAAAEHLEVALDGVAATRCHLLMFRDAKVTNGPSVEPMNVHPGCMTQSDPSPASRITPRITAVTRRDIFDYLRGEGGPWWGRLDEINFLEGLYDLDSLASADSRYTTARRDIVQHRINNPEDWFDDWVFEDPRFQLLEGPDEVLLAFLARLIHPEVQARRRPVMSARREAESPPPARWLDSTRLRVPVGSADIHPGPHTGHRSACLTAP